MSRIHFEVEELGILAIYQCKTRQETLDYIHEAMGFVDKGEQELLEYLKNAAEKLSQMSEQEYEKLDLDGYLYDQEEDGEDHAY